MSETRPKPRDLLRLRHLCGLLHPRELLLLCELAADAIELGVVPDGLRVCDGLGAGTSALALQLEEPVFAKLCIGNLGLARRR